MCMQSVTSVQGIDEYNVWGEGTFRSSLNSVNILQHQSEEKYKFATPSTMKPTQTRCSEGSINQIPPWTEVQGDIRLTPFYKIDQCLEKVKGYVEELNEGQ